MALTTRQLLNTGQGLYAPDGSILAGQEVTFILVDTDLNPVNVFDAITKEQVVGSVSATTDANGEFSVSLWPNDRGSLIATQYICNVNHYGIIDFAGNVPSDSVPLTWAEFRANGVPLTPVDINVLQAHIANQAVHLDAAAGLPGQIPTVNSTRTGFSYIDPPAGTNAVTAFIFNQVTPLSTWLINHNLGYYPDTSLFDTGGNIVDADVVNLTINQTQISFTAPLAGQARLL